MAYYFFYFNLKRCKECETRMHKPPGPPAESLIYQISSNCMTGVSEELPQHERACPWGKKWTPNFTLCRQLVWSIECYFFFLLCVLEEPGLSLGSCSEEDVTPPAPYPVFWQICWMLDFWTFVSALPRQLHCPPAWQAELYNTTFVLPEQRSSILSWLVYQTGFIPFEFIWPLLLDLFVHKTVNAFLKVNSMRLFSIFQHNCAVYYRNSGKTNSPWCLLPC